MGDEAAVYSAARTVSTRPTGIWRPGAGSKIVAGVKRLHSQ